MAQRRDQASALERERRRRADRERQHGAADDDEAVDRRALELRIGQRVRVPPGEKPAGGGKDRIAVGLNETATTTRVGSVMKATSARTTRRSVTAGGPAPTRRDSVRPAARASPRAPAGRTRRPRPVERVEPQVLDHVGDHLDLAAPEQLGRRERAEGPREDDQAAGQDSGRDSGSVTRQKTRARRPGWPPRARTPDRRD